MRCILGILAFAQIAQASPRWVGVDEVDLDTARGILRELVTSTREQARIDEVTAYGLDATPMHAGDVWVLPGCRRFTAVERDATQKLVDRWAVTKIRNRSWSPGRVDVTTGCWIGNEGVLHASFSTTRPDELLRGPYNAILVVRGNTLVLVDEHRGPYETTGQALEMTSAGDLDGDGRIDVVYSRIVIIGGTSTRREVVAVVGGKHLVIRPSLRGEAGVGLCPKAVLIRSGDARGVAILPRDAGVCDVPVGHDAVETWIIERGKLVRAPAIDRRLLAAHAAAQQQRFALHPIACAARCATTATGSCRESDALLGEAFAKLKPSADAVAAVRVVQRIRHLCQPE